MNIQPIIKFVVFVVIGILLGFIIGQTSIFGVLNLLMLTSLFCLIYVCTSFAIKGKWVSILHIKYITLAFVISSITSFVTIYVISSKQQRLVEDIIEKVENYKQTNSKYPLTLFYLNKNIPTNINYLNYWTDSTQTNFTIRYQIDGWHFREYDSKNKKWIVGD